MKDKLYKFNKNVTTIYSGIDVAHFTIPKKRKTKPFTVVLCSEYRSVDCIKTALNIIKEIQKQKIPIKYIFALRKYKKTDMKIKLEMQRQAEFIKIKELIEWNDTVKDIRTILKRGHIIILPYQIIRKKKDLPIVILEAMSMGLIPLINDIPPMNEIPLPKKLKINSINPKDIAKRIIEIYNLYSLDSQNKMRKIIIIKFSLNTFIKKYNEVYNKL